MTKTSKGFNVRQHTATSWRIQVRQTDPTTGKRVSKYEIVKGSEADANAAGEKLVARLAAGGSVAPASKTLAVWAKEWLALREAGAVNLRHVHDQRRLLEMRVLPRIGRVALQKLEPLHFAQLWRAMSKEARGKVKAGDCPAGSADKPLAARTIRKAAVALSMMLDDAVDARLITRNPMKDSKLARAPKAGRGEIEIPSRELVESLDSMFPRDRVMQTLVRVLVGTGMRIGEALGLQWRDIDDSAIAINRSVETGGRIKETKTDRQRRVAVLPELIADLRAYRLHQAEFGLAAGWRVTPKTLVFTDEAGAVLSSVNLVGRFQFKAGVGFHALRHYHASVLFAEGLDVIEVSRRLGHVNPTVTLNTYGHLMREGDDRVLKVLAALGRGRS